MDLILRSLSETQEAQPQLGRTISLGLAKTGSVGVRRAMGWSCGEEEGTDDPPVRSHPCTEQVDCYPVVARLGPGAEDSSYRDCFLSVVLTDLADTLVGVWNTLFSHCRGRRGVILGKS